MGNVINIAVIGYGYWGPNLVRNFQDLPGANVKTVSDLNAEALAKVKTRYPTVEVTLDCQSIFADPEIDAVAIATPVSTHFSLALAALRSGKHVLVEKPIAPTAAEAQRLIEEAQRRRRILMVDHTFVYTGAVRKMAELLTRHTLGHLYYYDAVRVNLGLFQHDVNVLWDLAVHDLSIMDYILPLKPYRVSATGMSHLGGRPENIAYLTLFFENNLIAHLHVNWLAPVKVRRTLIGGAQKMILFDDLDPSEKIKVYDKGVTLYSQAPETRYDQLIGYRTGDMWAPKLDGTEALQTELAHFVDCIQTGNQPITDGEAGLRVVKILEAATHSLKNQGRFVDLYPLEVAA